MTRPDARADQVRAAIAGQRFATAAAVAVCDNGRLVGLVRPEDLLAAAADATAAGLVDRDAVVVPATVDREVAVQRAVHRRRDTVAVVDDAGRFLGLIPPPQVLAVLAAEHDEERGPGTLPDLMAKGRRKDVPGWSPSAASLACPQDRRNRRVGAELSSRSRRST